MNTEFLDVEQNSDEWFAARSGRPTASSFSKIITSTGKRSSSWENYMYEIIGELLCPGEKQFETYETKRGHLLEPEARAFYAEMHPEFDVTTVGFISRSGCISGASPDALVYQDGKLIRGLEIKCLMRSAHITMLRADAMMSTHKAQVHGSMMVCNLDRWDVLYWHPTLKHKIFPIMRNGYTGSVASKVSEWVADFRIRRPQIIDELKR